MPEREVSDRKLKYRARLEGYLSEYKNAMVIQVDNVGSKQLQNLRMQLRGTAVLLMGKNTIIRKVIREYAETHPGYSQLVDQMYGNVGLVFTNGDLLKVRDQVTAEKMPAAAKSGQFAPINYTLQPGPTGLDPGQTTFFQALNIATKIVKGTIEIMNPVQLCNAGERVSPSAVSLLSKLNIKPFFYGIVVMKVFEDGSCYDASILDLTEAALMGKFTSSVSKLSALALAIGQPTMSTLPHSFARAFKKVLALAVVSEFSFKQADKYKEYLADPAGYAAKHGLSAAPAAGGAKAAAPAAAAAAAAKAPEPEPEDEEAGAAFDLFD